MEHVLKILMLPLYLISGVILPLAAIPQPYLDLLLLNPIAHGLELARAGFFPTTTPCRASAWNIFMHGVSPAYFSV